MIKRREGGRKKGRDGQFIPIRESDTFRHKATETTRVWETSADLGEERREREGAKGGKERRGGRREEGREEDTEDEKEVRREEGTEQQKGGVQGREEGQVGMETNESSADVGVGMMGGREGERMDGRKQGREGGRK
jgi:hypothetical protein